MFAAQHRQSRNPDSTCLTTVPQLRITSFLVGNSILVPNSGKIRLLPAPTILDSLNLYKLKGTGVLQRTMDSGETESGSKSRSSYAHQLHARLIIVLILTGSFNSSFLVSIKRFLLFWDRLSNLPPCFNFPSARIICVPNHNKPQDNLFIWGLERRLSSQEHLLLL